jgi:NADH-quinone oxidoreductase subunit C
MAEISNEFLLERLRADFDAAIRHAEAPYDLLTITVEPAAVPAILRKLHEDSILRFRFLTDICGSHYPDLPGEELCVIYHLHSLENNVRLRIKTHVPVDKPEVPTVSGLYASANWMERETYDFYGVIFTGHPDLRRILNADEMDYFPLRKEYPLEDATRTDKEDQYFGR